MRVPPPRTTTVLVFLAAFAVMLSWLVAYGASQVLVSAGLMSPWTPELDPRPRWMLSLFGAMMGAVLFVAAIVGWTGRRQLGSVEEEANA